MNLFDLKLCSKLVIPAINIYIQYPKKKSVILLNFENKLDCI